MGDRIQKLLSTTDQIKKKKINTVRNYKIEQGPPFKLLRLPNPVVQLRNILIKRMGIEVVTKNHLEPPKTMFLSQIILKITI